MFKKIIPQSEFVRNTLAMMTGTTIAQAIPIALTPILTRIYTPEDFGIFALYMSIATLVAVCSTGRYELAIMLPEKDTEAINIVVLSIVISFAVSLFSLILIVLFNNEFTTVLGNEDIKDWLYFIPITTLITGLYQSLNYWSNRKKKYKRLAINRVVKTSTTVSVKLGMGLNGLTSQGLIFGSIFGDVVATYILGRSIWKEDKFMFLKSQRKTMLDLMKKYKKLPIFNLPNALIDGIKSTGIRLLLAKYFSNSILGQYALAWNMLQLPMSIIGSSLSQVLFQKLSTVEPGKMTPMITKFILKAVLIPIVPFAVLYFCSESLFGFIFGKEWVVAGKISALLIPWVFMNFITSPISTIFIIHNKQDRLLIFAIFYMITPLLLIYLYHDEGIIYIIQLISNSMAFSLLIFLLLSFFIAKDFDKTIKES